MEAEAQALASGPGDDSLGPMTASSSSGGPLSDQGRRGSSKHELKRSSSESEPEKVAPEPTPVETLPKPKTGSGKGLFKSLKLTFKASSKSETSPSSETFTSTPQPVPPPQPVLPPPPPVSSRPANVRRSGFDVPPVDVQRYLPPVLPDVPLMEGMPEDNGGGGFNWTAPADISGKFDAFLDKLNFNVEIF